MTAAKIVKLWGIRSARITKLLQYDMDSGVYAALLKRSGVIRFNSIIQYALAAKKYYHTIRLNHATRT